MSVLRFASKVIVAVPAILVSVGLAGYMLFKGGEHIVDKVADSKPEERQKLGESIGRGVVGAAAGAADVAKGVASGAVDEVQKRNPELVERARGVLNGATEGQSRPDLTPPAPVTRSLPPTATSALPSQQELERTRADVDRQFKRVCEERKNDPAAFKQKFGTNAATYGDVCNRQHPEFAVEEPK